MTSYRYRTTIWFISFLQVSNYLDLPYRHLDFHVNQAEGFGPDIKYRATLNGLRCSV